jgi:hypothetical protein
VRNRKDGTGCNSENDFLTGCLWFCAKIALSIVLPKSSITEEGAELPNILDSAQEENETKHVCRRRQATFLTGWNWSVAKAA